jgi:hypothetical protein
MQLINGRRAARDSDRRHSPAWKRSTSRPHHRDHEPRRNDQGLLVVAGTAVYCDRDTDPFMIDRSPTGYLEARSVGVLRSNTMSGREVHPPVLACRVRPHQTLCGGFLGTFAGAGIIYHGIC